jgi:hypothetical protein
MMHKMSNMLHSQSSSKKPMPVRSITGSILLGLLVGSSFLGCSKSNSATNQAASPTAEVAQAQSSTENAVAGPAPAAPAPQPTADPLDLNRELRKWILRNRRPPKNFEDFAATSGVEIPPPPAGKKYVVDKSMHVVLANR